MKVCYDHQIFSLQNYGGISRYFCELVNELQKSEGIECELLLKISNNHHLKKMLTRGYRTFLKNKELKGKSKFIRLINSHYAINKIKKGDFDIFHPTYYDPYFLQDIKHKPFVLTIYDMINEKFPHYYAQHDKTVINKKLLAQKARKIIAISENTKRDIIKYCEVDSDKIEVISLATAVKPVAINRERFSLPERYLLFVGLRGEYKNFNGFLKAVSLLMNEDKDLAVLCAGGEKFSIEEQNIFNELKMGNRIFQHTVANDDELGLFYQRALAFVFPSFYEGFGIPILESFACGCPVIASNSSSIPEVAGDAAVYFDPAQPVAMRDAIANVLYHSSVRQDLITRGAQQLQKYSWEKTAQKTAALYAKILGEGVN